jgi:hypothetical protein
MSRHWVVILTGGEGVRLALHDPRPHGRRPAQAVLRAGGLVRLTAPDLYRSFAEIGPALGTVGEFAALERLVLRRGVRGLLLAGLDRAARSLPRAAGAGRTLERSGGSRPGAGDAAEDPGDADARADPGADLGLSAHA